MVRTDCPCARLGPKTVTHCPEPLTHPLRHALISTSRMPVLSREICHALHSQTSVVRIVYRLCSISYKRHGCIFVSFSQNSSIQGPVRCQRKILCLRVAMRLSPEECSIRAGERAIPPTKDAENVQTSWPDYASQIRTQ